MEKLSEIITVRVRETTISSDEGFNGTVVNRAMPSFHGDLLEITRTLPLNIKNIRRNEKSGWFCVQTVQV